MLDDENILLDILKTMAIGMFWFVQLALPSRIWSCSHQKIQKNVWVTKTLFKLISWPERQKAALPDVG